MFFPRVFARHFLLNSYSHASRYEVRFLSTSGNNLLRNRLVEVTEAFKKFEESQNIPSKVQELEQLKSQMDANGFWDDSNRASRISGLAGRREKELADFMKCRFALEEAETAVELCAGEEGDDPALSSLAESHIESVENALELWKEKLLLSGPYDDHDALLTISMGAGGEHAQEFTEMIFQMYQAWASQAGYSATVREISEADVGIRAATLEISGENAYGLLRGEKGVHRFVNVKKGKRQTCFCGVEVAPVLEAPPEDLELNDTDLEFSFSCAGGPGGQHVNKTETAVRILHKPTGIVVRCTSERSQQQNIKLARQWMAAKLVVLAREQHLNKLNEITGDVVEASWGRQIRSYVVHPYTMVKDMRTGLQTHNVESVFGGQLDDFLQSFLKHEADESSPQLNQEQP